MAPRMIWPSRMTQRRNIYSSPTGKTTLSGRCSAATAPFRARQATRGAMRDNSTTCTPSFSIQRGTCTRAKSRPAEEFRNSHSCAGVQHTENFRHGEKQCELGLRDNISKRRSHVVFHVEDYVRLAMDVRRDVIRFLRRKAAGLILRHIVLHERRHFRDLIHAGAVAVRIRPPKGRGNGKFSRAIRPMANSAVFRVDLASLHRVSIQFRKIDKPASREWMASHLVLREPLRIGD